MTFAACSADRSAMFVNSGLRQFLSGGDDDRGSENLIVDTQLALAVRADEIDARTQVLREAHGVKIANS